MKHLIQLFKDKEINFLFEDLENNNWVEFFKLVNKEFENEKNITFRYLFK
jgi:hypothetical protein